MADPKHPWVEDYTDFEVVLKCVNPLPELTNGADVRAFQTFGFDDASTAGNDRTYCHVETGVMVRFEDSLVAVEFSDERLGDALEDLFRVLAALGWRLADVYHPPISMNQLLTDLARAIPPNLDFDLRAASDIDQVSDTPEGAALVALGRQQLMGTSDSSSFDDDVMQEFAALDSDVSGGGHPAPNMQNNTGPVFLVDDDLEDGGDFGFPQANARGAQTDGGLRDFGEPDELPRVFYPNGTPEALAQARAREQTVDRQEEESQSVAIAPMVPEVPGEPIHAQTVEPHAVSPVVSSKPEPSREIVRDQREPYLPAGAQVVTVKKRGSNVVRVGLSTFVFDHPEQGTSDTEIAELAQARGVSEIVHLWPGAIGAQIRWDVLGELGEGETLLAEKIAAVLSGNATGNARVALIMQDLRRRDPSAQLRGVVDACARDEGGKVESGQSPYMTQNGAVGVATTEATLDFIRGFAGVMLCAPGTAFVDLGISETFETFTVREVMKSSKACLYAVRLDTLDGPLAESIFASLERLARCYESTKRHIEMVAANRVISAAEQARSQAILAATEKLAEVFQGLKDLGVTVPIGQ